MSLCSLVLCCDVRYDLRIKTVFTSSLPPVVCRRTHDLLCMLAYGDVRHFAVAHLFSFLYCVICLFVLCKIQCYYIIGGLGLGLWCLTPLSTIF